MKTFLYAKKENKLKRLFLYKDFEQNGFVINDEKPILIHKEKIYSINNLT